MRRAAPAAAGFLLILLAACAPTESGPAAAPDTRGGSAAADAQTILSQLVNTDNGLEVRRWVIGDDPGVIGAALSRYRTGEPLDAARVVALRRDGLRFVRVRAEQLNDLLGELDPAPVEVAAWHGQVLTWRELQVLNVGSQGITIAAGGRAHRFGAGRLRLMARSWTVPMEQGPFLTLELLPEYARPSDQGLRRLLGGQALGGTIFPTARVEALLEPGFAYVLVGAAPQARWQTTDAEPAPDADAPGAGGGMGPGVGPGALPPLSVGELLLCGGEDPPRRTLLVFVPRIPERLWRPYDAGPGASPTEQGVAHADPE